MSNTCGMLQGEGERDVEVTNWCYRVYTSCIFPDVDCTSDLDPSKTLIHRINAFSIDGFHSHTTTKGSLCRDLLGEKSY